MVEVIRSLHSFAWYKVEGLESYIVSKTGGRQGCKLGGVVFNISYALGLSRLRGFLQQRGATIRYDSSYSHGTLIVSDIRVGETTPLNKDDHAVSEITYVDDEAVLIASKSATSLVRLIPIIAEGLYDSLAPLGHSINWGKGKTEVQLFLRGKDKAAAEQLVKSDDECSFLPVDKRIGTTKLRVVQEYKHLGTVIDTELSFYAETSSRVKAAMSAYAQRAIRVFSAKSLSTNLRINLFFSLVVSRLIYGVSSWPSLSVSNLTRLNAVYMRGLRRIADAKWSDKVTNLQVRTLLKVPSLETLFVNVGCAYYPLLLGQMYWS